MYLHIKMYGQVSVTHNDLLIDGLAGNCYFIIKCECLNEEWPKVTTTYLMLVIIQKTLYLLGSVLSGYSQVIQVAASDPSARKL